MHTAPGQFTVDQEAAELFARMLACILASNLARSGHITYVRKRNERGDKRHPHHEVASGEG
jgi:hypothetical protein